MNTQPLDLAEIVHRVGSFVPCWTIDAKGHDTFNFQPQDLIACIKVCRLWRSALTPLLWQVFHEWPMSKRGVPEETLRAQSTHFRYAQLSHHRPSFDLQATLLRGLKLPPDTLMPKEDLIISNQRLTQLEFSFGPKDQYDRLIPALESLTLLQHVVLKGLSLDNNHNLVEFLNTTPT